MIFALVGNQNCGKTTIFNKITNMKQHIGNFPGVTVDIKIGTVPNITNCEIVDLPGLYSLNTYTKEETISKKFIMEKKPDVIINVIDAGNIERNLYLTLQLKQLKIPIVIALNMLDEVEKNNGKIDIIELEKRLNIPIVPITTVKKVEVEKLTQKAKELSRIKYKTINIENNKNQSVIIEKYKEIEKICRGIVNIPKQTKQNRKTYKIDKILTNKYLGIPIFILIMFLIFQLTFNYIGEYFSELINQGILVTTQYIEAILTKNNITPIIHTLITDGILTGIGSVVSFLPIIVTLYFFLSLLEDTGYMTRIAFIMDKPLSKIGLSGRSVVAILLGFGCSVPAILSTRTIQSEKEKKLTMLLVPFMSCSAKIPIYAIFISILFEKNKSIIMLMLYIISIIIGIIVTAILNKITRKDNQATFIIELPNYRIPSIKNIWHLMWNKTKEFIEKAFSIIFIASIIIWFLKSFDTSLYLSKEENSILAQIGKIISPIFKPLGFSDWRIITSLITGISAKEAVVSTLTILTNANTQMLPYILKTILTIPATISFLIFVVLYTPCIATISIIKKEFNLKTAIKVAINQFIIAYIMAFVTFQLSNFLFNFF